MIEWIQPVSLVVYVGSFCFCLKIWSKTLKRRDQVIKELTSQCEWSARTVRDLQQLADQQHQAIQAYMRKVPYSPSSMYNANERYKLISDFVLEVDQLAAREGLAYEEAINKRLAELEAEALPEDDHDTEVLPEPQGDPSLYIKALKERSIISTSAMYCNHANEVPRVCPCDRLCYCRIHGACRGKK